MAVKLYGTRVWQYPDVNITADDIYDYAATAYGKNTADYARSVASLDDFEEFSKTMRCLGVDTLIGKERSISSQNSEIPPIGHMALVMRYPFLLNGYWSEELENEKNDEHRQPCPTSLPYESSSMNSIETGWRLRFGLCLCEDIRTILERAKDPDEAFYTYKIMQIKEKYGSLRWYDQAGGGVDHDLLFDVIDLYEQLSEVVCISCGSITQVLMDTGGYILPVCSRCRNSSAAERFSSEYHNEIKNFAIEHGWEEGKYIPYELSEMIRTYMSMRTCSFVDGKIADRALITSYHDGEEETRNIYDTLKGKGLLIEKLIDERDDVCEKQALPTLDDIERYIAEEKRKEG